jgi:hypothetical protein
MYWFILLIPLLIAWGAKFKLHHTITWKEMLIQILISVVIVAIVIGCGLFSQTSDTEVWNGQITNKEKVRVSCSHSYDCFCVTVSCGKDCTTQVCQTCYDHDYDNNWRVDTNIDGSFNIHREDRQGLITPKRWAQVVVGEPYATEKGYTNYVKAVPESIFGEQYSQDDEMVKKVPNYPTVYDYYKIDRVQVVGVSLNDKKQWNDGLAEIAKKLGSKYKVNPIIQFVNVADPTYQFALERKWLNGKKNDVIIVFGVSKYPTIDFVRVVGWENESIKHYLKAQLELFNTLNDEYREYALSTISDNIILHYKLMKMEDYAYLKDQIEPPLWVIILAFVLSLVISIGLTYFFHTEDVFGDENQRNYNSRRRFK